MKYQALSEETRNKTMTDIVPTAVRSRMMSSIRAKNTKPEVKLRKALHALGFRFRIHDRRLPGTPDIVLPRWKTVIFVNGCFWHRHEGCRFAYVPASNSEFWSAKFAATILRDQAKSQALAASGWRVLTAWECEVEGDGFEPWLKQFAFKIRGAVTVAPTERRT